MVRWLTPAAATLVVVCLMGEMRMGATRASERSGAQSTATGSITAGRAHSVIALPDGRVLAWGEGDRGQIGDAALLDRWTPVPVTGMPAAVVVVAGAAHTLALTANGELYAWGANASGRLGDGTEIQRPQPVRISGLPAITAVAAGRAHSLALSADGRVFAWGLNADGQLGLGTRVNVSSPTIVPGLTGIVAIAAGASHSLAVRADGRVLAWGDNAASSLGDGTTTDRLRPVLINITGIATVAAGGAHSLALQRSGQVYAWGSNANGELGIGNTAIASRPTQVRNLTATAIAAGRAFSAALLPDGHVATWGANASGQLGDHTTTRRLRPVMAIGADSVAMLALGAAHVVAVTTTGEVLAWGEGGSGRLGLGDETDTATPVEVESDIPGWGGGEPGPATPPEPPTISPPAGIYPAEQLVGIAPARPGDIVRYTVDGSAPTPDSPQYVTPFRIETSTRVAAREFSPDGTTSEVRDAEYLIDLIPPTITIRTVPVLASGWMQTPVTVSFACDDNLGVAQCPAPVTVAEDSVAREVTGTAIDRAGHRTSASVTLNLDLRAPTLTIVEPADQSTTTTAELVVAGIAVDDASGLAGVWCNGRPAQLTGSELRCVVPLTPGRNDVVLHAVDAAGLNTSTAVSVTRVGVPTRLLLSPARRTLELNETSQFSLRDEFGASVSGAVWTSSEPAVVSISPDDPPTLTALALGSVVVRAEKDGLAAEAAVVVSPGLAPGDTRWTVPAIPGYSTEPPLLTNRVSPDVPYMFAIDTQTWGQALLRAVSDEGEVLWQQQSPGIPILGDTYGGVIAGVLANASSGTDYRAYARIGGGTTAPWRFESAGALGRPAQGRDGTLYAIEYLPGAPNSEGDEVWDKYAIVLDGASGRLLSRTRLAREVDEFVSEEDGMVLPLTPPVHCHSYRLDTSPETQGPVVGADGRGYLIVRRHAIRKTADCIEPFMRHADRTISMGVDLVVLSRDGTLQSVEIYSASCNGALGTTLPCDLPVRTFQLMPDGIGGTLVTWERGTAMVGDSVFVQRSLTRVDAEGRTSEQPVARQFWLELVGQAGMALTFDDEWRAMDVATGDIKWASPLMNLAVLGARPDGGLATLDVSTGELKMTDNVGNIESAQPFGLDWRAVHDGAGWIGRRNGELTSVVGEFSDATRWAALNGNGPRQLALREPGVGIFGKTHLAFPFPFDSVRYRHVSIRVAPRDWHEWVTRGIELRGTDEFGNAFFTIGAGSNSTDTNVRCDGTLVSELNRVADVNTAPWDPLEPLAYPPAQENALIQALLDRDRAYPDDLPYACRPEENPGYFNSNSYSHGLLNAVGLPVPRFPERWPTLAPGWQTPVPRGKFQ